MIFSDVSLSLSLSLSGQPFDGKSGGIVIFLTCYMNFLESIAIGNRPWTAAIGRDRENKTPRRRWAIRENQSYRRRTTRKENEWNERNKGWRSESLDESSSASEGKEKEESGGRIGQQYGRWEGKNG